MNKLFSQSPFTGLSRGYLLILTRFPFNLMLFYKPSNETFRTLDIKSKKFPTKTLLIFLNHDVLNICHTLGAFVSQPYAVVRNYFVPLFCPFLGGLTIIITDNDPRLTHG